MGPTYESFFPEESSTGGYSTVSGPGIRTKSITVVMAEKRMFSTVDPVEVVALNFSIYIGVSGHLNMTAPTPVYLDKDTVPFNKEVYYN